MDRSDLTSERVTDVVVWLFIALAGVGAAYVCFGILKSEASGQFEKYSVGGAIAGAVVSWGVLTSVYLQLRGSSRELQDLRDQTNALQSKLIRGAPRPRGFETEIDERQRVVLARPKDWQPKGGTIFDLELSPEATKESDTFAAAFRCNFVPIVKGTPAMEEYYNRELQFLRESNAYVESSSQERVKVGGETGVESLKIIVRQAVRVTLKKAKETGRVERSWAVVRRDEFVGRIAEIIPAEVKVGTVTELTLYGDGFRDGGSAVINGNLRKAKVMKPWSASVVLSKEDVTESGTLEVAWENADAAGKRSNARALSVSHAAAAPLATDDGAAAAPEPKADAEKMDGHGVAADEQAEQVLFQEAVRMRFIVYHEGLEKVFYFDFLDDANDFTNSSALFNQVMASARFLD